LCCHTKRRYRKYFFGKARTNHTAPEQIGKLEIANHGTLFIEDINEISLEFQSKLLAALQKKQYKKVGDSKLLPLDIRIIAATSQNLRELSSKVFLEDLYFYIHTFPVNIPPLRKCIVDIPMHVDSFVTQFNKKFNKNITTISKKSLALLQNYSWPGNIKELENVIERSVILSNTASLKIEQLTQSPLHKKEEFLSLHGFEREYIIKVLNTTFWRVAGEKGAAKILELHPETLRSKMRKLKIRRP